MPGAGGDGQRLDKFLWCARIVKSRETCARLLAEGAVRINRLPTEKTHARVRVGDVLTLRLSGRVLVLRVAALPRRRGTSAEAAMLYDEIAEAPPA